MPAAKSPGNSCKKKKKKIIKKAFFSKFRFIPSFSRNSIINLRKNAFLQKIQAFFLQEFPGDFTSKNILVKLRGMPAAKPLGNSCKKCLNLL